MKLLAVLVGSICGLKKRYNCLEIVGHVCMVIAACLFSLGDNESDTKFNVVGVILVLLSLLADSIHANSQEHALTVNQSSYYELMFYSNGIAAICSAIVCISTGEMSRALSVFQQYPILWTLFFIRCTSIYFGTLAYLEMTRKFGAVLASEVTTARKVLTVATSYYFFPKPFFFKHQIGSLAFVAAVAFSFFGKRTSIY
ncbi:UDP-galactose transporter [Reticulomyxa filosa]|uniref:UDP-galactose transporter n=1 Tax=Reticulomyxa filosa TaxID=46433 RepID=X6MR96_RETFI|nr:UDP-galactose transporter [Reticulomyxa filosa]|eukprot:ETO16186.1 UDP-galactose transporter [Reticulomyxa filosa]